MQEKLLKKMIEAVDSASLSYKGDFYFHDLSILADKKNELSPFFWSVSLYGTHLWFYNQDEKTMSEKDRFIFMQDDGMLDFCQNLFNQGYKIYHYDGATDDLTPIFSYDILEQIYSPIHDRIKKYIEENYDFEIPWYGKELDLFFTPSGTELYEKIMHSCISENLTNVLNRLKLHKRIGASQCITLSKDGENDFYWEETLNGETIMNGGLIYSNSNWTIHT